MFIINPDTYLRPAYRISPFRTEDLRRNSTLPECNDVEDYFKDRFRERRLLLTNSGREALFLALNSYNFLFNDNITILSTSGNSYISRCVTNQIEKICCWNRQFGKGTNGILVNHEFGYPFANLNQVKEIGLPLIEDCAHSFFSSDENETIGRTGDFSVYSFPKMFPIQIGGLLVINNDYDFNQFPNVKNNVVKYVRAVLSYHIKNIDTIKERRVLNYNFLKAAFLALGYKDHLPLRSGVVPGVFMFNTTDSGINLPEMKEYFINHGIESSVFYGEDAFFIPCHQNLTEEDMLYFIEVFKSYLLACKK